MEESRHIAGKVTFIESSKDAEQLIVRIARVSNEKNATNWSTGPKLLRFMMKEGHWSPFEMANFTVRIETTRDVSQQILRHRQFHFQEFSQRYAKVPRAEVPGLRRQGATNRQSSTDDLPEEIRNKYENKISELFEQTYDLYEEMLSKDIARETARRILPICSPTVIFMSGVARDWIHYIRTRTKPDVQQEHAEIARQIRDIFKVMYPIISDAAEL